MPSGRERLESPAFSRAKQAAGSFLSRNSDCASKILMTSLSFSLSKKIEKVAAAMGKGLTLETELVPITNI